jgi:hypothetical protein
MMKKFTSIVILGCFFITSVFGQGRVCAQEFHLPMPGTMVHLSPEFNPAILKGIKVNPDNPFHFDFILDRGDSFVQDQEQLKTESIRLIKYFLASLTIPEKDLWVNLSPYEKNRIVPESFGQTEMGRDLLAEDYMLKQITASLIYPEDEIGKKFWKRIYEEAAKKFGTTNIPVNTFNKVWIVPEKAVVYENAKAGTAYIVESKLKVMLEQDYLALEKNQTPTRGHVPEGYSEALSPSTLPADSALNVKAPQGNSVNALGSQIIREIVIPELTKEVNEGKNFAQLRQVYNSLILATWYKNKIKESILAEVYADKNKVKGLSFSRTSIGNPQYIYQQYLKAFKKGAFNYIKEEVLIEPQSKKKGILPRKYFSGGATFLGIEHVLQETTTIDSNHESQRNNLAMISSQVQTVLSNRAMIAHVTEVEATKVLTSILKASEEGYARYLRRFVEGVNKSSPQENPYFLFQWKTERKKIKNLINKNTLVKSPDTNGKEVYWILRDIKREERKIADSAKNEKLVYILGNQAGADFTEARDLSRDEWQQLGLDGQYSDYYLVKAVEKDNWTDVMPRDWSNSFTYLFVAGLFFSKIDTNIWNTGFIDKAVGLDSDQILLSNYDEEAFFSDLLINNVLNTTNSIDRKNPEIYQRLDSLKESAKSGQVAVHFIGDAIRRYGLGHGIIEAEGLNKKDISEAIRRIKGISNIEQAVHDAGFRGETATFVINKLKYNQFSLGRLADRYWELFTGTDGGFAQMDYPVSAAFAQLKGSWDVRKQKFGRAIERLYLGNPQLMTTGVSAQQVADQLKENKEKMK